MNKNVKNSLGLAQIPLMIVLLLMAIAVPVATKLVQDNADSRNLAREIEDCPAGQHNSANGRCVKDEKRSEIPPKETKDSGEKIPKDSVSGCSPKCSAGSYCVHSGTADRGSYSCVKGIEPTFSNPAPTKSIVGCICVNGFPVGTGCGATSKGQGGGCTPIVPTARPTTPNGCICDNGVRVGTGCGGGRGGLGGGCVMPTQTPVTIGSPCSYGDTCANNGICYMSKCIANGSPTSVPISGCSPKCSAGSYCVHSGTADRGSYSCVKGIEPTFSNPANVPTVASTKIPTRIPTIITTGGDCLGQGNNTTTCKGSTRETCVCKAGSTTVCNLKITSNDPTCLSTPTAVPTIACATRCFGTESCVNGKCMGPDAICQANHPGEQCSASGNSGQCICNSSSGKCHLSNGDIANCCYASDKTQISCSSVVTHTNNGVLDTDGSDGYSDQASAVDQCKNGAHETSKGSGKWVCGAASEGGETAVVPTVVNGGGVGGPTLPAGESSVLNYKIAYGGVNPNSAQCVIDWPLQFIVLGGGVSQAYTNEIPATKAVVGNKLVFSGSLILDGFNKTSGIAAFIKGPKHLQVKYGKDNQGDAYNQAGGELTLTSSESTSPIYDFSNYPITPGDVVGVDSEVQDGWINGVDFAYVKAKSLVHETVSVGGYLKGDLDGNCQVNSNDVNLLKISLQEKQGQLY